VFNERQLRILREYFAYYNEGGRINRWKGMRRSLERSSRQQKAKSFLCRKLADCIIAICGQHKSDWLNVEPGVAGPKVTDGLEQAGACF